MNVRKWFYDFETVNKAWAKANPKTESEILRFYAETDAYIYADQRWNSTDPIKVKSKHKLSKFCHKHNIRSVLDYGAGVGEYCLYLASKNYDVSYADLYGKLWDFSQWRFKQRNLPIKMLKAGIDTLGQYDLVICTDVLEHVKNPPSLAETLVAATTPKGYLCVTFGFNQPGGKHLDENAQYTDTMDSILANLGLQLKQKDYFNYYQKMT